MGESACVVQPFSYAHGLHDEANRQENPPVHGGLGESISFGRFMSESLAWEKWSTFTHKRYVEEAERYAQPGSVAQKKAFFEAHYKRIAAQKAAAAAAAAATALQEDPQNATISPIQVQCQIAAKEQKQQPYTSVAEPVGLQTDKVAADAADSSKDLQVKDESVVSQENVDNNPQDVASGSERSGIPQMERPLLKHNSKSTEEEEVSSSSWLRERRRPAVCKSKPTSAKVQSSPRVPLHPKKENDVTPISKKPTIGGSITMDKKRSSPKSLRRLINFTPSREAADKAANTPTTTRKNQTSRLPPPSATPYKPPKDYATPFMTPPITATANGEPSHHPSPTPFSENRRAKTPADPSASGNKTTGPRWNILSSVYSKSMSACKNKLQSPTISTPFILRTEERATRRKQKLEEKFNAKEPQKMQLQTKIKEKAGTELRKLGQSFCFKARPLPDFYRERETQKSQPKRRAQPQSPKLGRNLNAGGAVQETVKLPPLTSSIKNNSTPSKNVLKRRNWRRPTDSLTAVAKLTHHENTSPNIQH